MRRISDARKKLEQIYYKIVRPKYLEEHPICECCGERKSMQIHHKKGRRGQLLIEVRFFMAVCLLCHGRIEKEKGWAFSMGYRLDRIGNL